MATDFTIQFDPSEIRTLAARYEYADDSEALRAGQNIAAGDYSLVNLTQIVAWKSNRSKGRAGKNTEADVADALRLAARGTSAHFHPRLATRDD